jgi:hypothetical protein
MGRYRSLVYGIDYPDALAGEVSELRRSVEALLAAWATTRAD